MRLIIYQLTMFIYSSKKDDVYTVCAKTILNNIHKIKDLTITEIADMCYVSAATISRLCRKLNYESFADFKDSMNDTTNDFYTGYKNMYFPEFENMKKNACEQSLIDAHYQSLTDTLKQSYENIDYKKIYEAIHLIKSSKRVIFIGYYLALLTSIQFQIELSHDNVECIGSLEVKEQIEFIKEAKEDDIIIITSLSGAFFKRDDINRFLKRTKAKIILLSHHIPEWMNPVVHIDTYGSKDSLISKFTLTYIYELLEMFYTLKETK